MPNRTMLFGIVLALALGAAGFYTATVPRDSELKGPRASPVDELRVHLVGVHAIKEAPDRQYVAHHYCQELRPDLIQCAVFDSDQPGAKLVDVEYVVSDEAYLSFSGEEQQYWHPHDYEVDNGLLQAPELPSDQARELLNKIRGTHGRTWHLWAAKENPYPLGEPELAWSITASGQLREEIEGELKGQQP